MTAPSEPNVRSEIPPNSEHKVQSVSCNAKLVLGMLGTPYILVEAGLETRRPRRKTGRVHLFGSSLMGIYGRIQRSVGWSVQRGKYTQVPLSCLGWRREVNGGGRTRTSDQRLKRPMLYRLSYAPAKQKGILSQPINGPQ